MSAYSPQLDKKTIVVRQEFGECTSPRMPRVPIITEPLLKYSVWLDLIVRKVLIVIVLQTVWKWLLMTEQWGARSLRSSPSWLSLLFFFCFSIFLLRNIFVSGMRHVYTCIMQNYRRKKFPRRFLFHSFTFKLASCVVHGMGDYVISDVLGNGDTRRQMGHIIFLRQNKIKTENCWFLNKAMYLVLGLFTWLS